MQSLVHECFWLYLDPFFSLFLLLQPAAPPKTTPQPPSAKLETWLLSDGTSGWVLWPCLPPRTCPLTLVPLPWRHARSPATPSVPGIQAWRTAITPTLNPNTAAAALRPNPNATQVPASAPHLLTAEDLLRPHPPLHLLTPRPNTQTRKMVKKICLDAHFIQGKFTFFLTFGFVLYSHEEVWLRWYWIKEGASFKT